MGPAIRSWNHDSLRVAWCYRFLGDGFLQFSLSPAGKADALYFLRGEGYPPRMIPHRDEVQAPSRDTPAEPPEPR